MLVITQCGFILTVAAAALYGLIYTGSVLIPTYLLLWSTFHSSEYFMTWKYLPRTVTPYSFLIYGARGSAHLAAVHFLSLLEHVASRHFWSSFYFVLGVLVALSGIGIRALAISTCGNSFSHYIETRTESQLVTTGIYSWCRHPSYLGFLMYVCGMQMVLRNVATFLISVAILFRFFTQRIRVEEWFLVHRLYGQAYVDYQSRVLRIFPGIY